MKKNNIQKMPKAGQAGNGTKPHVTRSVCDWHLPTIVGHYYTECPTCCFLTIEVKQTDV